MKKTASILSLILLLLVLLTSCTESGDGIGTDLYGNLITPSGAVGPQYEDNTICDIEGAEVKLLAWRGSSVLEFESAGDSGVANYGEAVMRRNQIVKNKLDCKLVFSYETSTSPDAEAFIKRAEAEENVYIYAAHNRVIPMLAIKGYAVDLNTLTGDRTLNFDKPWWPSGMDDGLSVDGKLYFATGDISMKYIESLGVIFYNKAIIEKAGISENALFRAATTEKWTLTEFEKYIHDAYGSLNGNTVYGFALGPTAEYAEFFFESSSFKPTATLKGKTEFSITDESAEAENAAFTSVRSFFSSGYNSVSWNNAHSGGRLFSEGRAAFTAAPLSYSAELNGKINYGIIPVPKYSEAQSTSTPLIGGYTLYSVCSSLSDEGRVHAASVLQSLGAASANILLPAYTSTAMKTDYRIENLSIYVLDSVKKKGYFEVLDTYFPVLAEPGAMLKEGPSAIFRNEILSYVNTSSSGSAYRLALQGYKSTYSKALEQLKGIVSSMQD